VNGVRGTVTINLTDLLSYHLSHQLRPRFRELLGISACALFNQPWVSWDGKHDTPGWYAWTQKSNYERWDDNGRVIAFSVAWVNALSSREVTQLREDTGLCGISYGTAPAIQCIQDEEFVSFWHRTRRSWSVALLVAMAEFMFLLTLDFKQMENSGVSRHRILF